MSRLTGIAKLGRPTKLDDLLAKRIVDALRRGVSRRCAANGVGVSWTTMKNWCSAGRNGEARYEAFLARVETAEAEAEGEMVDVLYEAAKEGKVDAAKFWLQQRRALEWNQRDAPVDEEQKRDVEGSDIDVTRSVLAALESRKVGT